MDIEKRKSDLRKGILSFTEELKRLENRKTDYEDNPRVILKIVNSVFNSDCMQIGENGKLQKPNEFAIPRHFYRYLLHRYTSRSLREVAAISTNSMYQVQGYSDHATILHSIKVVNELTETNPVYKTQLKECELQIEFQLSKSKVYS